MRKSHDQAPTLTTPRIAGCRERLEFVHATLTPLWLIAYFARMSDRPRPTRGDGTHSSMPVRIYRLGEEPTDDVSAFTTPEERLAMVWELTARAWALAARPRPAYERPAMPVGIRRPG